MSDFECWSGLDQEVEGVSSMWTTLNSTVEEYKNDWAALVAILVQNFYDEYVSSNVTIEAFLKNMFRVKLI